MVRAAPRPQAGAAPQAAGALARLVPASGGEVGVRLTRPAHDTRHVRACVLVHAPLDCVWELLTDYTHLADHVPNLAESTLLRARPPRVRQAGAQRILGFEFRANVTLDMREVIGGNASSGEAGSGAARKAVHFERAPTDRGDFQVFKGTWLMIAAGKHDTELHYDVTVSPRGLVPVAAIEWRISEDVPANLDAVRSACERRHRAACAQARRNRRLSQ